MIQPSKAFVEDSGGTELNVTLLGKVLGWWTICTTPNESFDTFFFPYNHTKEEYTARIHG